MPCTSAGKPRGPTATAVEDLALSSGTAIVLVMVRQCVDRPDRYLTASRPRRRSTGLRSPGEAGWRCDQGRDLRGRRVGTARAHGCLPDERTRRRHRAQRPGSAAQLSGQCRHRRARHRHRPSRLGRPGRVPGTTDRGTACSGPLSHGAGRRARQDCRLQCRGRRLRRQAVLPLRGAGAGPGSAQADAAHS